MKELHEREIKNYFADLMKQTEGNYCESNEKSYKKCHIIYNFFKKYFP